MSSQVVEELVMELKLELAKFRSQTQEAERLNVSLKNSVEGVESATDKASEATDGFTESSEKAGKQTEVTSSVLAGATTKLTRFFTTITSAVALERLASGVAKVNDQLNFMQRRLDLSARSIMGISNAAAALGGDAGAMQETMKGLNQQIQQLVIMGDASVLPFFNALGVGVVDAQGKVRDMDQIILDMADSLGKLDPRQAYAIASAMGLDEATTNALVQGRNALQEMLSMQNTMYVSTQAELDASRELNKQQAILSSQYTGLKTMLGNALIPLLTKLTKGAQTFTEFLLRNERSVKNVFEGIAYVIGVLLVGATYKALTAMTALLAPIAAALAPVLALGAAFVALYDDYKVWSEGGKSLFDWTKFDKYIKNVSFSVENLKSAFVRLLTGYNSWDAAVKGFTEWLKLKGFLDDTGVSVDSLAEGFKNLVSDMLESMPVLQKIISALSKIASGDFSGALKDIASIPAEAAKSAVGMYTSAVEHVVGAADTAFGVGPEEDYSLASAFRGMKNTFLGWFGVEEEKEEKKPDTGSEYWIDESEQDKQSKNGLSDKKLKAIKSTADKIGVEPNDLAAVISFETGGTFDPNARNPKSSATGLIQKMRDPDGTYYGMTRDEFGGLSFEDQLKYVERYFKERGFSPDKKRDINETYAAVTGYGYRKGTPEYDLNKVWDSNKDGYISKDEVAQNPQFKAHQRDYFAGFNVGNSEPRSEEGKSHESLAERDLASVEPAPVNVSVLTPEITQREERPDAGGENYVAINNNTENNYITREKPAPAAAVFDWIKSLPLIGKDSGENEYAAQAESINRGAEFTRTQNYTSEQTTNQQTVRNEYNISMGGIAVQTSANNMQNVTQEAVLAGAEKASTALDQIVGGL